MHLFAGAGGGLLADLILGHTPVVAVEWDAYCCAVLRERAADGWFPGLRVHEGDVRMFDPSEYAGRVDCIAAGFPCQDISSAGKRAGVGQETRSGLYREVLRIAGLVRPGHLFLENVAAIVPIMGTVVGDLAALGYDCRWLCLRASAVGAPHHRDRWWCLADTSRRRRGESRKGEVQQPRRSEIVGAGEILADSARQRCGEEGTDSQRSAQRIAGGSPMVADAHRSCGQRIIPAMSDSEGWPQPSGGSRGPCGDGIGWWSVEPDVGRVAYGMASRVDRVRALGNGQVPLQAAVAWRLLGGP